MGVKVTWFGRAYYAYVCGSCGESLRSKFTECGTEQNCGVCGILHVVPGRLECEAYLEFKAEREAIK
jgi:hypothetical protein